MNIRPTRLIIYGWWLGRSLDHQKPRHKDAGVTLIEMLVALALFALIGVAGFTILDSVLRTQSRTEAHLDRLKATDLTLSLLARDITQMHPPRTQGAPQTLILHGPANRTTTFTLTGGTLTRQIDHPSAPAPVTQSLLPGLTNLTWRYLDTGWNPSWGGPGPLRAIALTLVTPRGEVHRLFETATP